MVKTTQTSDLSWSAIFSVIVYWYIIFAFWHLLCRLTIPSNVFCIIITLCRKLPWFCHTNSGQLFCNCPLFVIALVPGLFLRETRRDVLSFCCCFKMAENSVSLLCRTKYCNLNRNTEYLRGWQVNV